MFDTKQYMELAIKEENANILYRMLYDACAWIDRMQAKMESAHPSSNAAEVALIEGVEDSGTRLYTESEVQEIIAQAEQRVFRALSKALGGPGWTWLPETRRKLTRQVRKVMSKMGKRPEVSNG